MAAAGGVDPEGDVQLAKAVSHPLRAAIFRAFGQEVASPTEIAHRLKKEVHLVSYHVRRLLDLEQIELVRTRPVRGAREHFYRVVRSEAVALSAWDQLDPMLRRTLAGRWLQGVIDDFRGAAENRLLEASGGSWMVRTPLIMDAAGIREAQAALEETHAKLEEIEMRSVARIKDEESQELPVSVSQGLLRVPSR